MKFLRFLPAVLAQSPFENVDCNLNCAQGVNCCENQNSEIQPELEDAGEFRKWKTYEIFDKNFKFKDMIN